MGGRSTGPKVTRRRFAGALACLPAALRSLAAAGSGAAASPESSEPRIAVIGAGAFGVWTALHLRRLGAMVDLFDAWGPGNARASSGGESRVIRAIYGADHLYVRLVRRSFELWEELQSATGTTIYRETGALWMVTGDDGYVRSSLPALEENNLPVDAIPLDAGRRRWPQIDFDGIDGIWLERRAGMLYARDACMLVRGRFVEAGGRYRQAAVRPLPPKGGSMPAIDLGDGRRVQADRFVFACGPWLSQVFPEALAGIIRPTRQEVHFFGPPAGDPSYGPDHLPVWVDMGERVVYGLPDARGGGFKIADDTRGAPIDPTTDERVPTPAGLDRARRYLARRFPGLKDAPLTGARVCQYENSPDGHLILDRHPEANNVWIAGGGSGHGFKLSPAIGELAARCVLRLAEPEERFLLRRLRPGSDPSTQFDNRGAV